MNCSWCKVSYHNHDHCLEVRKADEHCDLGMHKKVIVPPSWIIKLPRKGSFKSSLKNSPKKCAGGMAFVSGVTKKQVGTQLSRMASIHECDQTQVKGKGSRDQPSFLLKPIPSPTCCPVIVFLNPRSGGNQGFLSVFCQHYNFFQPRCQIDAKVPVVAQPTTSLRPQPGRSRTRSRSVPSSSRDPTSRLWRRRNSGLDPLCA